MERRRWLPPEDQERLDALEADEDRRAELLQDELNDMLGVMKPRAETFALVDRAHAAMVRRTR